MYEKLTKTFRNTMDLDKLTNKQCTEGRKHQDIPNLILRTLAERKYCFKTKKQKLQYKYGNMKWSSSVPQDSNQIKNYLIIEKTAVAAI